MCPPTFRKLGSSLRRGEPVCNMCNELFQWLEVQENICKFDLYVLCDYCVIICNYISVCVCACVRTMTDERNKPIKSTTESLSGVPCFDHQDGKPIEICSPGTLFVFLAEARSATNDAKPPWNSRSRFYHLLYSFIIILSSFLMFFTSLTWSFSLSPTFDLAQRHKLWHERHAELEFENPIPLQTWRSQEGRWNPPTAISAKVLCLRPSFGFAAAWQTQPALWLWPDPPETVGRDRKLSTWQLTTSGLY